MKKEKTSVILIEAAAEFESYTCKAIGFLDSSVFP
jgi:hypothetical protein